MRLHPLRATDHMHGVKRLLGLTTGAVAAIIGNTTGTALATFYWVVIWGGAFGAVESYALFSGHPEWTLSECIWRLIDYVPGQTIKQWSIVHLLAALFMTWLYGHFIFGMWHTWRTHRGN